MNNKYDYQCPDCGKAIKYLDKFCKECGCKIDWDTEENDKQIESKKINNNETKENDILLDYDKNIEDDNKEQVKYKKHKGFKVFLIVFISFIISCTVIIAILYIVFQIKESDDEDIIVGDPVVDNHKTKEEIEKLENEAKEIWRNERIIHAQSGKDYITLFEYIITEEKAYEIIYIDELDNPDSEYSIKEVIFSRDGNKVTISKDGQNTVKGVIEGDKLILDGRTSESAYVKIK
jgi:hypothetical protein